MKCGLYDSPPAIRKIFAENPGARLNVGSNAECWVNSEEFEAMLAAGEFNTQRQPTAPLGYSDPHERKSRDQLLALADVRAFDFAAEVPPPHPVFSIGDRIISTPGNITALSAQAKAGKSAVVGAMIAAVFNDNRQSGADTLGITAMNPDGLALVHLDTEQSRHDHDKLVRKAIARAMVDEPPAWFRSYWLTDLPVLDRRLMLPALIERAATECGGVFAVILDGGADLIASVNDEESARGFVAELHTLAIKHECVLVVVVHENPGTMTGKTRGHFGSEIERKAETNLRLERESSGTVTMWAERARHCCFPKQEGICFGWSITAGMFVSRGSAKEIKSTERRCKMAAEIDEIFADGEQLTYTALVQRIVERLELKERSGKDRVKTYLAEGLLTKSDGGSYSIPQ